jgi:hypothetical protein
VIRVDPPDRATSTPSRLIVATESFSERQVTGRITTRPRLSRGMASSRTSSPTLIGLSVDLTAIASARGGATVTRRRPSLPSHLAVIRAEPGEIAVATALVAFTRRTAGLSLFHSTGRPGRWEP